MQRAISMQNILIGAGVKNGGTGSVLRLGRGTVRVSDPDEIYVIGRQHPTIIST